MSTRVVTGVQGSTVSGGSIPCIGGTGTSTSTFGQSGVRLNEALQIVFPGKAPFNLTQTVCDNKSNCWCGPSPIIDLKTNTYNWTVNSIKNEGSASGQNVLFAPDQGHTIIWIAIERQNVTTAGSTAQYYTSPNFTYSTNTYDNPPASRGSASKLATLGLTGWGVMGLAILGVMMGM